MTRQNASQTIKSMFHTAAKAFGRRNMRCGASHHFEIMPAYLLADLDVSGANTIDNCQAV